METITVKPGQSLIDMSVEHSGSVEVLVLLAVANGIGVADDLPVGAELSPVGVADRKNAELFGNMLHKPATALSDADRATIVDSVGPIDGIFDYTYDETYN